MSAQIDAVMLLQPCVQRLVLAFIDAFPGSGMASGRRGIDDQARADAADIVQSRNFIADTYAPSDVRSALVELCDKNPTADAATLQTLIAALLGTFSDEQLSHFSLHLSGYAVDLEPIYSATADAVIEDFVQRVQFCTNWVQRFVDSGEGDPARCKVLTKEAGLTRLHVQLFPKGSE
jgi:hypothetical protein